jgi:hypothetical protein
MEMDSKTLVGSWRVSVFEEQGPPTLGLATFGADGNVVTAEHPVVTPPGAPGVIFTSSGHGSWKAIGNDNAIFTFVALGSDELGNLFCTVTISSSVTLGIEGENFDGDFMATMSEPQGSPLAKFNGKIEGVRIAA